MRRLFALVAVLMLGIPFAYAASALPEIPETYEQTLELVGETQNKFLMYTFDGENIMWGVYGNGYFAGTDNLGENAWGVYEPRNFIQSNIPVKFNPKHFKGYYNETGNLFEGKTKGPYWDARNLFNREQSRGLLITFPVWSILQSNAPKLITPN